MPLFDCARWPLTAVVLASIGLAPAHEWTALVRDKFRRQQPVTEPFEKGLYICEEDGIECSYAKFDCSF